MMFPTGSLQLFHELGTWKNYGVCRHPNQFKRRVTRTSRLHVLRLPLLSDALRLDAWALNVSDTLHRPRYNVFICRSFLTPDRVNKAPVFKAAATALARSYNYLNGTPLVLQLVPAVGIIAFAVWGLGPLMRWSRNLFFKRSDSTWKKSSTYYILTSYLQPLLLWTGATLICRVLDPVTLPSEASQVVKHRLLTFVRSLSTVLAFAYCLSSLVQQAQKFFLETRDSNDARNMGFQFAGKAVYTGVWVAAVSLFMELLGFSTQRWMTAGGLGTVLLTLAGREIFTNFLSSVMIHATRPFVVNEWIQAKIEGYEVSGTVEHVGWWSPTIIRGDDREAVHIPNHKFTVSVVRNLSQKTHWRVKTHIAISHLDASKINNIVADMRKVLAKNAQVEQQRLHRRVFLDDINPENQALLILVSCFVRTSHVEEYLCVKEAILLDLLRVVSHHRARLATPIRTVQKVYADTDLDNIPFAETIFTRAGAATHRPLLLIESAARIKGEDKTNPCSPHGNEEDDTKAAVTPDSKATASESVTSAKNGSHSKQSEKANVGDAWEKSRKAEVSPLTVVVSDPSIKPRLEGLDLMDEKIETLPAAAAHTKHESERLLMTPPAIARPTLEENIVLGVALEGSKRTLPIEEGMSPITTPAEAKELATCRNGNDSKNRKENQVHPSAVAVSDQRDH